MIIALSGSSSCGKNTVIKELIKSDNIKYIQSFTSREKREGESEGSPYFFLSKEEFQAKIKNNDFFEHELIHTNFYGVEKNKTLELLNSGKHLVKDIGVIGTFNLKEQLPNVYVETIYLNVNKKTLKKRLINRGDKKDNIKLRLKRYKFESSCIKNYNFVIDNYNLEHTLKIIKKIIEINNKNFYEYILPIQKIDNINIKKLNKICDKLINNKVYKPLEVYFNGENFYLKKKLELYLAGILTNKTIAKKIIYKNINFKETEKVENVINFIKLNRE